MIATESSAALGSPRRLAAVAGLNLTGHLGDPYLDAVVHTLALACRVPMAVVNIATPGLQTYPAEVGVGQACTQVPDELSFCAGVVETGAPMTVSDASIHPRYGENPLVRAGAIGAYAGHPVVYDGQIVGVLSLFDDKPRIFSGDDLTVLRHQAHLVEAILTLRAAAAWDESTRLARRPLLVDRLDRAMTRAWKLNRRVGLMVVDVNGMAELNLRYGSASGDAVLAAVAERLTAAVASTDSVARIGGDEFAVILEDLASTEEARARAAELAGAARGSVAVDGNDLPVEVAYGVASALAGGADALLAASENAVSAYAGHAAGYVVHVVDRTTTAELRRALNADEFVVHYQPVVNLRTGDVAGVEGLVRWQHPQRGLLPPAAFIDEAEESGAVIALGAAVLRKAVEQLARWHADGRDLTIAVNLSPKQMAQDSFVAQVGQVLEAAGVPAHLLVLEITESSVLDHPSAPTVLAELQGMGVRLALDDFGTGYSSLSYLRRFPVDTIKIDRSFVGGLGVNSGDEAIVASVVSLAAAVRKDVVAEGVETLAQAERLRLLGVELAQGFLWSPALPADQLEDWLAQPRTALPLTGKPVRRRRPRPEVPGGVEARIWDLHTQGASLHTIAAALNASGLRTPEGVRWHTRSVALVLAPKLDGSPRPAAC
ncbi:MAG: hypothetical protein NVSMB55_21400 [Mycobacteriales bacterium]